MCLRSFYNIQEFISTGHTEKKRNAPSNDLKYKLKVKKLLEMNFLQSFTGGRNYLSHADFLLFPFLENFFIKLSEFNSQTK